jgi:hypothetical protein
VILEPSISRRGYIDSLSDCDAPPLSLDIERINARSIVQGIKTYVAATTIAINPAPNLKSEWVGKALLIKKRRLTYCRGRDSWTS